ncbi:MAG TPA: alpha/beta family hydrolase [Pirellulales bacterium]
MCDFDALFAALAWSEVMTRPMEFLIDGTSDAKCTVALAHGAGAGMDTPFMARFAAGLAVKGLRVARFEFPYMAQRRRTGKRRPPDREPTLRESWLRVIEQLGAKGLVIGGKSLGGRIASLVADEAGVAGLVCLGYPFHPPGQPDKLRVEHLIRLRTPTLIIQGERDSLGSRDEVVCYNLPPAIQIKWLPDGDHSFKPRKSSGRTEAENWNDGIDLAAEFVRNLAQLPQGLKKIGGRAIFSDAVLT